MITPERFDELMLDFAYDLLDEAEARAVREFLNQSPEAQARLRRVKELLAQAARQPFPAVVFQPPAHDALSAPGKAARPVVPARRWRIVPWLVAASVLVAVLLGAQPLGRFGRQAIEAERAFLAAQQKYQDVVRDRRALTASIDEQQLEVTRGTEQIQREIQKLNEQQQEKLQALEEELANQQLILEVSGPEAIQPGAPNHFQVATLGRQQRNPVSAKLHIRVLGEDQSVLYEEKDVISQGVYTLHLPPDLPIRLNTPIALDITASGQGQIRGELNERLSWASPRYLTHLATDKPLYQPGQTVYYRSLTLNRANLLPPDEDFHLIFTIQNPAGAEIHRHEGSSQVVKLVNDAEAKKILGPDQRPVRGVGVGEFSIPEDSEGGEYTLTVSEAKNRFPAEKRKFLVTRYTPDRLEKALDFHRATYGPGDEVLVQVKVRRAGDAGPVEGIQVASAVAQIDDQAVVAQPLGPIDATGRVTLRFELPRKIDRGRAALTVTLTDGGAVEAIQKPIPIVLKKVFVDFFPEGGELVADVPNRVYFRARTSLDRPAQLRGRLVNSKGEVVASVETLSDDAEPGANQGLGAFRFVPVAGEKYELRIDSPQGIDEAIPLLSEQIQIRTDTVAMSLPEGVTSDPQPLRVDLYSVKRTRQMLVGAYCRGVLLEHQRVRVEPGQPARVELKLPQTVGGVVRVTAFEEQAGASGRTVFIPRAERLVYRKSERRINISIDPDRKRYTPGDKVSVTLTATDETGKPARAIGLISVVDQTVITMADDKTARALPTHFSLVGEVRKAEDLEYADFLFTDHPKAAIALDLLLGVQGWRRFAEQSPEQFRRQEGPEAERVLVLSGQAGQRVINSLEDKRAEVRREFEPKFAALLEELSTHLERERKIQEQWETVQPKLTELNDQLAQRETELTTAARARDEYRDRLRRAGSTLIVICGGGFSVLGLMLVLAGLIRGEGRRPAWVTAGMIGVLLGVLLLGSRWAMESRSDREGTVIADAVGRPRAVKAVVERQEGLAVGDAAPHGVPADRPAVGIPEVGMFQPPAPPLGANAAPQARHFAANAPGMGKAGAEVAGPREKAALVALQPAQRGAQPHDRLARPADDRKAPGLAGEHRRAARERLAGILQAGGGPKAMRRRFMPPEPGRAEADHGNNIGPGAALPMRAIPMPALEAVPPSPDDAMLLSVRPEPFIVREYAHIQPESPVGFRTDFTETVYWNPVAVFDPDGRATATFHLSDSVTSFRILVAAHTVDGRLGQAVHILEARKPFSVETRLPAEMSSVDRIDLPIQIRNNSEGDRAAVLKVFTESFRVGGQNEPAELTDRLVLTPNQSVRRVLRLQPTVTEGSGLVKVHGSSEPFAADALERRIRIVPDGFPVVESVSDVFAVGDGPKVVHRDFELPTDYVPGTLRIVANLYPSPLADLQQGLDAMLQEPLGCFEQSSSGNYPNTLIMSYLREKGVNNPSLMQRAAGLLDRGYERLVSFECLKPGGGREGYEWFGGEAPPHEALTAYGLLQFHDMARVYPVDAQMLSRTRAYLLSRRRPDGRFQRNERALDSFGRAPQHITDAYIIWALCATGDEDLSTSIDKLLQDPAGQDDPYFLSLMAHALAHRGQMDRAADLLRKVKQRQAADGGIDGAQTSITSSGGHDLRIETTALAILAWLRVDRPADFHEPITRAVRWITQQRSGSGGFGSTQATILALKALLEHTKTSKRLSDGGELKLFAGDRPLGEVRFLADRSEPVTLEVNTAEQAVKSGKNSLRLELHSKAAVPYSLAWSYHRRLPPSSDKCPLRLATSLDRSEVQEGDGVRLRARVQNVSGKGLPMTVAILGIPAGLRVPEDMKQLREMARLRRGEGDQVLPGDISFFEIRGRELVLYWRDVKPDAVIELTIDLRADYPGEFRGPASRAYLYYDAEHKHWVEPLAIRIKANSP